MTLVDRIVEHKVRERAKDCVAKAKPKDSGVWLEELVEAAKAWRASLDMVGGKPSEFMGRPHLAHVATLATAVDGYRQAIKDEVEAEMAAEEKKES